MTDISSNPILKADSVCAGYGKRIVIDGVSLEVAHGETFGLIGLNGVGKTTFIKTILGLRECDSGQISIDGQDRNHSESKSKIAYLPERFEPPWFLSGLEFVKFSAKLYGVSLDSDQIRADAARLDLEPSVLGKRVQTYSKGMRQKLGLLATFLTSCPLLILDEPMSGLDPRARAHVKDMLREARAAGRTICMSSHILADMNEICDRVAVLHAGQLLFTGSPEELRKQGNNDNLENAFLSVIANS